jgi:hypothetical protein
MPGTFVFRKWTFAPGFVRPSQIRRVSGWYLRCFVIGVAKTQTSLVYDPADRDVENARAEMSCHALIATSP